MGYSIEHLLHSALITAIKVLYNRPNILCLFAKLQTIETSIALKYWTRIKVGTAIKHSSCKIHWLQLYKFYYNRPYISCLFVEQQIIET